MSIFLDPDDVALLTGYDQKSYQIEYLLSKGIFHHVNAAGHPIVPISAAEGRDLKLNNSQEWQPAVLNHGQKTNR